MTVKSMIGRHPVTIFFILTLAWSTSVWVWLLPSVQAHLNLHLPEKLFWLGECAPGLVALLLTGILSGKKGLIKLLKPVFIWRVNPIYYFIIFIALGCFYLSAIGLSALLGAHPPTFLTLYSQIKTPFFDLPAIWLIPELSILYLFCEELGWRGFALSRLLTNYNAFNASIIVGFIWALFHIPLMLGNASQITLAYLIGYVFSTILSSFLFTWIYLKTNRSLLTVGLLHGLIDAYGAFSPTIISTVGQGKNYTTIFLYFIVLLPIVIYFYKNDSLESKGASH
jgi:membrane protease YdiL (CAAX protease family)